MKRIYLILILALACSAYAFGAGPEDEILAAEKGWAKAVIARDFAALEKIYHDGLIYAHSTGTIETKAEYMAKLRSGKQSTPRSSTTKRQFGPKVMPQWLTRSPQ